MFWSKNKKNRYTPAYPSFDIQKWGLRGCTLHGHVFLMKEFKDFHLTDDLRQSVSLADACNNDGPGPEVIKLFSSSAQLSMKFQPLINAEIVKHCGKLRLKTQKLVLYPAYNC